MPLLRKYGTLRRVREHSPLPPAQPERCCRSARTRRCNRPLRNGCGRRARAHSLIRAVKIAVALPRKREHTHSSPHLQTTHMNRCMAAGGVETLACREGESARKCAGAPHVARHAACCIVFRARVARDARCMVRHVTRRLSHAPHRTPYVARARCVLRVAPAVAGMRRAVVQTHITSDQLFGGRDPAGSSVRPRQPLRAGRPAPVGLR